MTTPEIQNSKSKFGDRFIIRGRSISRSAIKPEAFELDSVDQYLEEIGQYPLLNRNQEFESTSKITQGQAAFIYLGLLSNFENIPLTLKARIETSLEKSKQIIDLKNLVIKTNLYLGYMIEPLNSEDLVEDKIQTLENGAGAFKQMVESNLRLVVSIARKYQDRGLPLLDLIQEGNIGLTKATQKFDEARGFKFSTYATWWIKQAISRSIGEKGKIIRVPLHVQEKTGRVLSAYESLIQENGHEPNLEELSHHSKIPIEYVNALMDSNPTSLDLELGNENSDQLKSIIEDKTQNIEAFAEKSELKEKVNQILNHLTARERKIIRMRFGMGDGRTKTLEEISNKFDITRERIRQIEEKAIRKLRHPAILKKLKDFKETDPKAEQTTVGKVVGVYHESKELDQKVLAK